MGMKRLTLLTAALLALALPSATAAKPNFRLLYWNIQNGMWDGQNDNYDRFVDWVCSQDPDVCVWCEAQSIYYTDTDRNMKKDERYLIKGWEELAARYGHKYVYIGGHRDNFPQAITSKYPIENVDRIIGNGRDSVVMHGCGWARMNVKGRTLNIVSLHLAPHQWRPGLKTEAQKQASAERKEGDRYRRMEIEYICNHTIGRAYASGEYWMMMGDFNSRSRADNAFYRYEDSSTKLLVHDYIASSTPYRDVMASVHPGEMHPTMHYACRLDYVYATPALLDKVVEAHVSHDYYTEPVRDPQELSNFWRPSDHRPIIVDFKL